MPAEISAEEKAVVRLKEGENDPETDRIVQDLIFWSPNFTVYVDDKLNIEWYDKGQAIFPEGSDEILAEIVHVKALSSHLHGHSSLRTVRCLLAECVAQLYHAKNTAVARATLERAKEYLKKRSSEIAKQWSFYGALIMCGATVLYLVICWAIYRCGLDDEHPFLDEDDWNLTRYATTGAFGALLSLLSRSGTTTFDAGAGRKIYLLDGILRVLVGVLGGYLIVIGFKADAILGFARDEASYLGFLLAFAAGVSERIVPQFVSGLESQFRSARGDKTTEVTRTAEAEAAAEKAAAAEEVAAIEKAAATKKAAEAEKAAAEEIVG